MRRQPQCDLQVAQRGAGLLAGVDGERIAPIDAEGAGELQRAFDIAAAQVFQHRGRHHADRLRNLADRRVGLAGAGRAGGTVALHGAVGGFFRCADGAVAELHGGVSQRASGKQAGG
ncbi:hypothetical protein D9M69_551120 [compost metagenome]